MLKMNWKKGVTILTTFATLLSQGVSGSIALAETLSDNETSELRWEQDSTSKDALELSDKDQTISLISDNTEDSTIDVLIPADVELNLSETQAQNKGKSSVEYNQNSRELKVTFDKNKTTDRNAALVLKAANKNDFKNVKLVAKSTRNDGKEYRSKALNLSNATSSPDSSSEEAQDGSDDSEDGQPAITEKTSAEPKKETTETTTKKERNRPQVRAGNRNVDLDISPASETVLSGQDATYTLNFKVTGNQTNYTNAKITVDIPKEYDLNQDLSELAIAGVTPTRDGATGQLVYTFDSIAAGQAYTTNIKLKTMNGTTPDGTVITLTSNFSATEFSGKAESKATVTVNAKSTLSTSKAYISTIGTDGKEKKDPPTGGDSSVWNIKVNASQKNPGLVYFKEGSKITIKDTIPSGITYVSDDANGSYDKASNTVTWTFDAPIYEVQKNAVESLFSKEINLKTKFNSDVNEFATFENKVSAQGTDISDKPVTSSSSAQIITGPSDPNEPIDPSGQYFLNSHDGPPDGNGNTSLNTGKNYDPTVYDTALLGFNFTARPWTVASPKKDFTKYDMTYDIDPNLNLDSLNFSGYVSYQPYVGYPGNGDATKLSSEPKADISLVIDGKEKQIIKNSIIWDNGKNNMSYSALGLKDGEHVSQIKIHFTNAPAGMNSNGFYPKFTIKKGFTGTVTNKVHYDVAGYNVAGDAVSWDNESVVDDVTNRTGLRTAEVVPTPPAATPIAKSAISFDKDKNGIVDAGKNRISGSFAADKASPLPLNKSLSSTALLPVGVKIDEKNPEYRLANANGWDDATTDGKNTNGTIKIISNDYNGTKRQLVQITWNDSKMYGGQSFKYGFNTIIDKTAPTPLRMDTYGFSGDAKISVPSGAATLTDSYLQTDTDDINGNGNTTEPRVLSSNQYRMIKENKVDTTKLVKGDQDKAFSKFGHASPGGKIDYQLTMKNTGSSIGTFAMMDVLPSVGDLGITDNVSRDSKFAPIMTGPISLPGEWNGKVTIKYSEATNPKRDDLDKLVDYPSTTQHLENPAGAQLPQWKTADQVSDWSKIHSFIVTLDDGKWTSGAAITLNFSMKAPDNLTKNLTDKSKDEKTRAAWNSFAYTADNSQVVEPERVGVVVNATEPIIHKDVEDKQHLELTNRDQAFNWHVNAEFGDSAAAWTQASIVDQINPVFTINSVKVADETGKDVTANGTVTTDKNKVVFNLNKKENSFSYLSGHTYTMTINTVIGKDVTDEQLAPYIKDGGIPNQADLNFGNEGDVIHSEKPNVIPPEETPDIHKDVENKQHLDLSKRDQAFDWHVNTKFGNTTASWTQASIVDQINPLLTINSVKVADESGKDVTANGTLTTDKNKIVFSINKKDDSFTYLAGHTYTMTINTVIGKDVTDEQLAPYIKDGGIPNQADLNFGNKGDVIHSEIPTVTPPKENPDIHKDVEDKQHLDLTNRDQAFNWHVNAAFGNTTASWTQASIVDQINTVFTINSVKVKDETGKDVTANGTLTTDKNKIVFDINKKDDSFTYLAGHTYTMTINTVIGKDVTDEQLAPYIKDGGIPNQADLNFGNKGDVIHSEKPTVIPPKENPDIHKDIEEKQHLDLAKRDQAFDWHVNTKFGNTTASWTQASIVDQINPLLTINNVKVKDETGKDVTENGTLITDKNKIVFDINKKDDGYTYLAGHTYTMTITTVIGKDVTDEQLAPYIKDGGIPNQADLNFGNEGDVIHSEIPTVTPPKEVPDIHKDVENKQHVDLTNRDQAFDWHVNTKFGNTTASWTQASIVDEINPLLTINSVKVVDENGKDVTKNGVITTDKNKIVFDIHKKDDSFTYLAGHTYTMTINTVIGKDVTDEQLAPYIKDGGIPNQADLNFGNEGDVIHSEVPTVIPPKEDPDIHKDVEDKQHLDLAKRDQAFDWHVKTAFGNTTASWKQASIVDQINPLLTINKVKVVDENGKDVTENGKLTTDKNKIVFNINKKDDSFTYLAGHTYTMTINTVIGKDVTDEQLAPYIKDGGIPNQADLNFGNDGDVIHSEIPTVTPPEEVPDIHKDVEDKQQLTLSNRDQDFNWHVNVTFGNTTASWKEAKIVDQIDPLLTINSIKVFDEKGKDVTSNGEISTESNKVVFNAIKKDGSFAYLAGHTYTMTINTVISKDVTNEQLAPYIKNGGIPNQADLVFGNGKDVIHSEVPKVVPPKDTPKEPKTPSNGSNTPGNGTGRNYDPDNGGTQKHLPQTNDLASNPLVIIAGLVLVAAAVWISISRYKLKK
ncbi:isopeptide-forming domain-containing fimbrial protein [Enterococcus gilvus]|uniref:isopeptide-forming domain-containing fimbrial protein n=1 Tax=Enterococcus gilvus TaxID=160453 RepID=UPI0028D00146|nr:isopeptide-forming domain-containing fimbrial protein [Enterococcus gilvus]